jgi:hypothetical protein
VNLSSTDKEKQDSMGPVLTKAAFHLFTKFQDFATILPVSHTIGRTQIVFEYRVLRKIFGSEREEVAGVWRLHKEELRKLYASSNAIRVMKSRRMRWVGHVARMGGMANA